MMKMHFDFAVTIRLKVGDHFDATPFVLFSRKEVCMAKRRTIVIAHRITGRASQFAPVLQLGQTLFSDSRLKMIGDQDYQVRGWWRRAGTSRKLARAPKRIAR